MGRELMKCDAMFSHELIKESPFFQISGNGLFTNRKVSNDRLNPTRTGRKLAITPLRKGLVGDEGLGLSRINRIVTTPSCALFSPSIKAFRRNPPVGTIVPLIKTRHLYKVWNAVNTKANQIRVNLLIINNSLSMSRTGGSNPPRTGILCHNNLRWQVQPRVLSDLILDFKTRSLS